MVKDHFVSLLGGYFVIVVWWRSKQSEWCIVFPRPFWKGTILGLKIRPRRKRSDTRLAVTTRELEKGRNATKQQSPKLWRSDVNDFSRLVDDVFDGYAGYRETFCCCCCNKQLAAIDCRTRPIIVQWLWWCIAGTYPWYDIIRATVRPDVKAACMPSLEVRITHRRRSWTIKIEF